MLRAGSCRTEPPRLLRGDESEAVRCAADWGSRENEEQGAEMDPAEFVRVLAHEVGHLLGLGHLGRAKGAGAKCQVAASVEGMALMKQQRATTVRGTPCSASNKVARLSRHVGASSLRHDREVAERLEVLQRDFEGR